MHEVLRIVLILDWLIAISLYSATVWFVLHYLFEDMEWHALYRLTSFSSEREENTGPQAKTKEGENIWWKIRYRAENRCMCSLLIHKKKIA